VDDPPSDPEQDFGNFNAQAMSAVGGKADIAIAERHVWF
jgi:hypothetical protein